MKQACDICHGTGEYSYFKGESRFLLSRETCPACEGTGFVLLPGVCIREIQPEDSLEALTELLHRAYQQLLDLGFKYYATHQGVDVTRNRIENGTCFVACREGAIVGTVTLYAPEHTSGCTWYDRPDVASFGQFGVLPECQKQRVGTRLLETVEQTCRDRGHAHLGLDTAEGAAHLIAWYEKRGYQIVEYAEWEVTNYRSAIMNLELM